MSAAAFLAGLVVLFIAASSRQLSRGRAVDCGCFGSTGMHPLSWLGVARNAVLLALLYLVIREPITAIGLDQLVTHHRPPMAAADALALVEIAALVSLAWAIGRTAFRLRRSVSQFERSERLAQ